MTRSAAEARGRLSPLNAHISSGRLDLTNLEGWRKIWLWDHRSSETQNMAITIDSKLEARLRERAEAEGLSVAAYIERFLKADQAAEEELESLALEGLKSGDPIQAGPGYWEEKHRRLDERLKKTGTR